ncbi:MAG: hypothetical protein JW861_13560 [Bacteroidales bacterium]|nr:hypothetical protein [Bacteroidales bacterium]
MHYSYRKVRRKGKQDGQDFRWRFWPFDKAPKDPYPPVDQEEPALYESELFEIGQQKLMRICADWKETDKKLKSEYCMLMQLHRNAEESLHKETQDAAAAAVEVNATQKKLSEFPQPTISRNGALFWLLFIGVVEFPLNSIAFQILGAGLAETYLMAAGMCATIPLLAHWFGKTLKQSSKSTTEKIFLLIVPVFAVCLIISLAIFREVLFDSMKSHSTLKVNLSPSTAAFLFIIINLGLFLAATLISYSSSFANQSEYNRIHRIHRMAMKVLRRESEDAEQAAREKQRTSKLLAEKRQLRQKSHSKILHNAQELVERIEWLVRSYRTANLYVRHKGLTPKCFNAEPRLLSIPDDLKPENLDWQCHSNEDAIVVSTLN